MKNLGIAWVSHGEGKMTADKPTGQTPGKPSRSAPGVDAPSAPAKKKKKKKPKARDLPETGGPKGPEPTRYGDWERKGRCVDF